MAKTIKLMRRLIARFGKALELKPRPLPDEKVRKVGDFTRPQATVE
ncbi:MAG: hypothetical protein IPG06_25065 [Haliea sp.]|nr:hypothetical protein [Haliea sp.]